MMLVTLPPPRPIIAIVERWEDPMQEQQERPRDANGWLAETYETLIVVAGLHGFEPEMLGKVIGAESEFRCGHASSGARGLTQMLPETLVAMGWMSGRPEYEAAQGDFCRAPPEVQLDYAIRYFDQWRRRFGLGRWRSVAQMFLANFLPADLPHTDDPGFVLARQQGRRAFIWQQNQQGLDLNHDGRIVVGELQGFVERAIAGRAKRPYGVFLDGLKAARARAKVVPLRAGPAERDRGIADMRDVKAVQRTLALHGFDPGAPDGLLRPRTRSAIFAFQVREGLRPDGVVGVFTWAELASLERRYR